MKTVKFSGYTWFVKDSHEEKYGPGTNYFSSSLENVWIDSQERLHLKITYRDGCWYCSEVLLDNPLGYGIYEFLVEGRFDLFDPSIVVGLFLYQNDNYEFDIEFARFNGVDNLYHTIQQESSPSYTVSLSGSHTTHRMSWSKFGVLFLSLHGHYERPQENLNNLPSIIKGTSYGGSDSLPDRWGARVHMNCWLREHAPRNGQEEEIIITKFSFYPGKHL